MKRNFKPGNGAATADGKITTPKAAKTAKPKTPASATGTKGRKRKVDEANASGGDDDEGTFFAPKSQKVRREKGADGEAVGAQVFKTEEGDGVGSVRDEYVLFAAPPSISQMLMLHSLYTDDAA